MNVFPLISEAKKDNRGLLVVLIDPDKITIAECKTFAQSAESKGIDIVLVGGSLLSTNQFGPVIETLKANTKLPVVIFPGSHMQVNQHADAILFLSLISGRNPEYLIGNQVIASPMIKAMKLEPISTGYMIIDSGKPTSASFMSNSLPIPRNKPDIAAVHALAAEYLGMKQVYLEGGSGAENPVPVEMIQMVSKTTSIPIWVGGGIKTPEDARIRIEAGATAIVIGTHFEKNNGHHLVESFAEAIKEKVGK